MGLKKFQIVFDNPWNTYYCGQPVTGRIVVAVDSQKKVRGLVVHFKGEASVKWDVTETKKNDAGNNVQETTNYTGNETYFENKFNVLGGGGNEVYIEAGEHSYPFTTYLPPNLPSSFEGEFGFVRYTVKAILDRPWKFDQDVKAAFTVISPLDLNTHDTAKNPVKLEKEKYFCCCCCKSGPLTLVLNLPVGGYVPGQAIPVTVELDNNSSTNVSNVICTLRKMLVFKARSPSSTTKKDKVTIIDLKLGNVAANSSKTWTEQLVIPPLPPSNLQNCNIIDLDYELKIEAKLPGLYPNAEIKTPIVLGTVPLINYQPPPPVLKEPVKGEGEEGTDAAGSTGVTTGSGWNAVPQQDPNVPAPAAGEPGVPAGTTYPQQPQWGPPPAQPPAGSGDGAPPPGGYSQWGPPPAAGAQWGGTPSPQEGGAAPPGSYPQQPQWGPPPAQPPAGSGEGAAAPPQGTQWGPPGGAGGQWGPPPPGANAPPSGNLYPTLAPPTFAESTFGPKDIKDASDNQYTQGNLQFVPRYPVYNYQPQPPVPASQ